jgi:hypothetical protein
MIRDFSSTPRAIRAVAFHLHPECHPILIAWLDDPSGQTRLENRQRTCLTARAGDIVLLGGERATIRAVTLHSVFPSEWNGMPVTCAADWLADCQ